MPIPSCLRAGRLLLAAGAATALLLTGTVPAQADSRHPTAPNGPYVALGDSYAAGEGLAPYDASAPLCDRSVDESYPARLAQDGPRRFDDLTSLACTMATTGRVLATQVPQIDPTAQTITLTVGGNDIGFAPVIADCLSSPVPEVQATLPGGAGCRTRDATRVGQAIAYLGGDVSAGPTSPQQPLSSVIAAVRARAPRAQVLVSGYPQLFGRPSADCQVTPAAPIFVTADDVRFLRSETRALNRALARSVERVREDDPAARVRFVDPAPFFAGHGLCDRRTPWITGLVAGSTPTAPISPSSFHPTAVGQGAYAAAFVLGCRRRW